MATRLHGLLCLSWLALAAPVGALPPCGEPGTISSVTAPDGGDYLAAFGEHRSYLPLGLALDPAGQVHVSDGSVIYRLESDGSATRIVGVPQTREERAANVLQDSVAALEARIGPEGLAFDRQGRLYFVDYVNRSWPDWGRKLSRIARLDPDGQVVTVAGGEYGSSGDGGPAKEARFGVMAALAFDREGRLLVAGTDGIRQIDGQGVVTTLVEADLVTGVLVDDQGVVFFSQGNQVFRRSADGAIEIVAGSRVYGDQPPSVQDNRSYSVGEGRLATEVPLYQPWEITIDEQGALYILDQGFHRIHRIWPDGVIETVAGNGLDYVARGCAAVEKRAVAGKRVSEHRCQDNIGNGGPALEAPIWWPFRQLLTSEGDLLVSMLNELPGHLLGGRGVLPTAPHLPGPRVEGGHGGGSGRRGAVPRDGAAGSDYPHFACGRIPSTPLSPSPSSWTTRPPSRCGSTTSWGSGCGCWPRRPSARRAPTSSSGTGSTRRGGCRPPAPTSWWSRSMGRPRATS